MPVLAVLAAAAALAAPASASGLPKLWATISTSGNAVYKVRPHTVDLAEAAGGTLTLAWSSWTATSATGAGTAVASGMGTTTTLKVTVKASAVKHGKFTRFTLTTTGSNGSPDVEHLHLTGDGWGP
jgi:hypothetical protein